MDESGHAAAAALLWDLWERGATIAELPPAQRSADMRAGYAIQASVPRAGP